MQSIINFEFLIILLIKTLYNIFYFTMTLINNNNLFKNKGLAPLNNNQPSKIDVSIKATLHFNNQNENESEDNISEINDENSYN